MLTDRYEYKLSSKSQSAVDSYIDGVDRVLSGAPGLIEPFDQALLNDPDFALAHCGLARAKQVSGDMAGAKTAAQQARAHTKNTDAREDSHINAICLLIEGKTREGYAAVREHLTQYPRDAMVAQTSTSIFGLIGFSGQPGREAELLAYTHELLPHYGEDWWFLSQHAFSLCETGQLDKAAQFIDRSLAINPRNCHAAHVKAHIHYEVGETDKGLTYLEDWIGGYDRSGLLHGHLSWHVALWALEQGDIDRMWKRVDADVQPGSASGLPINILTDTASILYRAELAGVDVPLERWKAVSAYAKELFPKTSLGFIDVHAALAHAMAGDQDAVREIINNARGPSADLVEVLAKAYEAVANKQWAEATNLLSAGMADHARIGGSRAQRDLLEFTLLGTLLKQDRAEEARRLLTMRRPTLVDAEPVAGLQ